MKGAAETEVGVETAGDDAKKPQATRYLLSFV